MIEPTTDMNNEGRYQDAVDIVVRDQRCSTSYVQRRLAIGYNKAAALVERMEAEGIVSKPNHVGKREICVAADGQPQEIIAAPTTTYWGEPASGQTTTDQSYRCHAGELRAFVERIERLNAEKKDLADVQKEVFAEAKGSGYDTKVIRKIVARRKRDAQDLAEEDAVMDMYQEALGAG